MTIIAGIFSRHPDRPLPDRDCEALLRSLSRHAGDRPVTFRDRRVLLAKVDIGAYREPAFHDSGSGSAALLAGEPLLDGDNPRSHDLERLHASLQGAETSLLATARGVFCAADYRPSPARLTLLADPLGLRLLYYCDTGDRTYFASALRILEAIDGVPKVMDLRGCCEMVGLGYPLADRTPYAHVRVLRPAEIVSFEDDKVVHSTYRRWDRIPVSRQDEMALAGEAFARFETAVARRLRGDRSAVSYLSGGLDSRCIVAALRARGAAVHTFNFGLAGTQDQVFAAEFARRAGATQETLPRAVSNPQWSFIMREAWGASERRRSQPPERPDLVWSGDGGSVSVGMVYMGREIVKCLRSGRMDDALEIYRPARKIRHCHLILRAPHGPALAGAIHDGIRAEIEALDCEDPARRFHLFLLHNDQRRHLSSHFEDIDRHRIEMHLPFYDADFLATILSVPLDLALGHRFYGRWLQCFPEAVRSVPWQSYPGHEPCPLPIPPGLSYQWDPAAHVAVRRTAREEAARRARDLVSAADFPRSLLRRTPLRIAAWLFRAGLRDDSYLFRTADVYRRYWTRCSGQVALPPLRTADG